MKRQCKVYEWKNGGWVLILSMVLHDWEKMTGIKQYVKENK